MTIPGIRRSLLTLAPAGLLLADATPGLAGAPFAGSAYPHGASDFLGGILPPQPGFYLTNYIALIQKDRMMDDDGSNVADFQVT